MIASNTAEISNTASFISSIAKCENKHINDPDNGLSCCFEDNLNKGIFKYIVTYQFLAKFVTNENYLFLYCSKSLRAFRWLRENTEV